jgi:hypothetical protein
LTCILDFERNAYSFFSFFSFSFGFLYIGLLIVQVVAYLLCDYTSID